MFERSHFDHLIAAAEAHQAGLGELIKKAYALAVSKGLLQQLFQILLSATGPLLIQLLEQFLAGKLPTVPVSGN